MIEPTIVKRYTFKNEAEAVMNGIVLRHAIAEDVCPRDVLGDARFQSIVKARHGAMLECLDRGFSSAQVGAFFNRDASSIQYVKDKRAKKNG